MELTPLTVKEAMRFLGKHKRHYRTDAEPIFAIGVMDDRLRGAVVVGKHCSAAELVHIYCDGVSQGYTLLYGAAWRAAKALGYKRMFL